MSPTVSVPFRFFRGHSGSELRQAECAVRRNPHNCVLCPGQVDYSDSANFSDYVELSGIKLPMN